LHAETGALRKQPQATLSQTKVGVCRGMVYVCSRLERRNQAVAYAKVTAEAEAPRRPQCDWR
jgi:hypothetical protein